MFTSGVRGCRHATLIKPTVATIKDGGSSSFWEMWVTWLMPRWLLEAPVHAGKTEPSAVAKTKTESLSFPDSVAFMATFGPLVRVCLESAH